MDTDQPVLPDKNLLSRRPWYLIGATLVLLSLLLRQPLLIVAGLLVAALGAIPEVWYRYCLRGVTITQSLSERHVMFGETVTLNLRVENRKLLPLPWLQIDDEFPDALPLHGGRLHPSAKPLRMTLSNTVALWLYQRVTRRYTIRAVARGAYLFGPFYLRSGDPFGLLTREQWVEEVTSLIVYPPIVPIERLGLPPRHPFGERAAPPRLLEDPLRIAGVRPYRLGDDPRRIHWKATARVGDPQSKLYEPAARHTLALFIDVRTLDQPVLGYDPALFELAMCTAASVVSWALHQGYAIGAFANGVLAPSPLHASMRAPNHNVSPGDTEYPAPPETGETRIARLEEATAAGAAAMRVRLPPSSNPAQLQLVLEALARLYPYLGTPIESLIVAETPKLPLGATLVYIGAVAALGASGVAALEQTRAHGHPVTLLLTDDTALATAELPTYRIGGREVWHALEAEALDNTNTDSPHTLQFTNHVERSERISARVNERAG